MFDFFSLSQHRVTAGQMETSWVIKQNKSDRTVNHKIVPNCRAADGTHYNPAGIYLSFSLFLLATGRNLPILKLYGKTQQLPRQKTQMMNQNLTVPVAFAGFN